jgi:hypothetical protein
VKVSLQSCGYIKESEMGTAVLKGLFAVGTKLLVSMASETVIKWAFFYIGGKIVESTKTDVDDAFLEKIKETYPDKA